MTATASPGQLDASFGTNGVVTVTPTVDPLNNSLSSITRTAMASDGSLVFAGPMRLVNNITVPALQRVLANGQPDESFGPGGIVVLDGLVTSIKAVGVQSDGDVIVVGSSSELRRVRPDGTVDSAWGADALAAVAGGSTLVDLAIDSSDRVVVVGRRAAGASDNRFVGVRLAADGTVDQVYGEVAVGTAIGPRAMALAGDGSPVVLDSLGLSWFATGTRQNLPVEMPSSAAVVVDSAARVLVAGRTSSSSSVANTVVARYTVAGPDPTFGEAGVVISDFASTEAVDAITVDRAHGDLPIVIGNDAAISLRTGRYFAARFTAAGVPDSSFGVSGVRTAAVRGQYFAGRVDPAGAYIDAAGRLVIVGSVSLTGVNPFVARVLSNGTRDETFGSEGHRVIPFVVPQARARIASALAVDPVGRPVVATPTGGGFRVLRFSADGSPDGAFGNGGSVTVPTQVNPSLITSDSAGRVLVAGSNIDGWIIVRLTSAGWPDASFGVGGVMVHSGAAESLVRLAVDDRGRILLIGSVTSAAESSFLMRLTDAGAPDTTLAGTGRVTIAGIRASRAAFGRDGSAALLGTASGVGAVRKVNADGS
ncbi:MAG TPA: hypothetical protein VGQ20_16620, partial [Acidimicrobiales bacterium]|nr:hypothetical protein [Acidimicrobiales bacterium]